VPLDYGDDGRSDNFTIETKTEFDALIDVLGVPFSAQIVEGRYAPAPPPESSAAPHGSARPARWSLLWSLALGALCSVWLRGGAPDRGHG